LVIEADKVTKAYRDNILVDGMTFSLPRGGIVGIIGPNGAGKTTLFRMIIGQEKPDAGAIRVGESVKLAYVEQSRETLDPKKTIWEIISGGRDIIRLGSREVNSRAYVARFNFFRGRPAKAGGSAIRWRTEQGASCLYAERRR
jgi:ATPase subunit of ABC transporter with duplicated ATPase domains